MIVSYHLKTGIMNVIESNCGRENTDEYCDHSGLRDHHTGKSLGPWTKLRYDKQSKALFVEQHMFGTPEPIYITEKNQIVFLSESLMKLKNLTKAKYELNSEILPHFFYNGFLAGSHTLVKGVYKLPLGKRLVIKDGQIKVEEAHKPYGATENAGEAEDYNRMYDSAMVEAIKNSISFLENEKLSIALSSGYDSNCILHYINQLLPENTIDAYSVGGYKGVDETANAQAIAKKYRNVSFYKATVTPKTLAHLDDIVLRLEGSVYERGIFLQYELAKLLNEHKCRFLVCGECADQVFNRNAYVANSSARFLYDYIDTPLEMAYYVVMRKSVSLLNSFGIRGIYPFIDDGVIKMGYATGKLNGTEKTFHKQKCIEKLPAEIGSLIIKQGGSTSLTALFEEKNHISELLEKHKYYDANYKLTQKYSEEEALMDYYLTLQYVESFERQFCDD